MGDLLPWEICYCVRLLLGWLPSAAGRTEDRWGAGAGSRERGGRAEGGTDRGREEGETRRERERQAGDPGEEEARNGSGRDVLTGHLVPGSVGQGGV